MPLIHGDEKTRDQRAATISEQFLGVRCRDGSGVCAVIDRGDDPALRRRDLEACLGHSQGVEVS